MKRSGDAISASFRNVPYIDITVIWTGKVGRCAEKRWSCVASSRLCKYAGTDGIPINSAPILKQVSESGTVIAMRYHVVLAAAMMVVLPNPSQLLSQGCKACRPAWLQDYAWNTRSLQVRNYTARTQGQ